MTIAKTFYYIILYLPHIFYFFFAFTSFTHLTVSSVFEEVKCARKKYEISWNKFFSMFIEANYWKKYIFMFFQRKIFSFKNEFNHVIHGFWNYINEVRDFGLRDSKFETYKL